MRAAARLLVLSVVLVACGGSDSGSDDDDSGQPTQDDGGPGPVADGASKPDSATRDAMATPQDAFVYVPPPDCGDGNLDAREDCDDGNLTDADGCDATCHREVGFNCPMMAGACVPICGDRMLVSGENCDDGGSQAGDGCSEMCKVEAGWSCISSGMPCVALACGDGIIAGLENCDDGNDVPGDGCDVGCQLEAGWICASANVACAAQRCGDGIRAGAEACDDGFVMSGDGCTAGCDAIEPNYSCPIMGGVCTRTSVCGNGLLTSDEQCDDRNTINGDGCSALCTSEAGWQCASVGRACTAASCGDGIIAGSEQCEDGNAVPGDGCSECAVEPGWACTFAAGVSTCHHPVCGDSKIEGDETCEDGNDVVGDGCGPNCAIEPICAVGAACVSKCGDGIKLASDTNEQCDDGNVRDGDGCSSTCTIESGFTCTDVVSALPASFPLTVVYRDFIRASTNGSTKHPDFETFGGSDASLGMVTDTLVGGKPKYTGICESGKTLAAICGGVPGSTTPSAQTTSESRFNQWYADAEITDVMKKVVTTVNMAKVGSTSAYRNPTFGTQLFPLDNLGWVATTPKQLELPFAITTNGVTVNHNFGFTTEIHHWFEFNGGEVLTFSGDDDVWVFIAGKLALDLGGLHSKRDRTISISAAGVVSCYVGTAASGTSCGTVSLGLVPGNVYEMALFHAERHTNQSNFDLTLNGFVAAKSVCVSKCGDGIVTSGEVCDDGSACAGGTNVGMVCANDAACPGSTCVSKNDASYGHCNATCDDYGPHCGDAMLQSIEQCDSGYATNNGGYNGCTQACTLGPRCGDMKVDGYYGEQCDLGTAMNTGAYNGCTSACRFGTRCGDAIVQAPEACDDGMNTGAYGRCAPGCVLGSRCGDGVIDRAGGEECDDGAANDGHYGGCSSTCHKAARCGDRMLDTAAGEQCDDGNVNNYDGCSATCLSDIVI
ncbi:MAG: Multiple EGF-like-domain protein 3 precursor [Myxococcaceae bacterium]|nr:Multiple EGF-like-domain protein 3 precursor [Myxococcaceae bacterium]